MLKDRIQADTVLDVRGLNCPLPILRTKMIIGGLGPGQVLKVLSTDPHSVLDFKAFCTRTGHRLLYAVEGPEVFEFYLRRRPENI
ncbi:MAG: sulfurtransferase TusA family protein [Gammaproteobacteria bacterium]|nr:sulfurtransferase TusA family protein [Gammaproteobacteria bacterium]